MNIGFIGVGAITEAVVRGLCGRGNSAPRIVLSPRNTERAATLAAAFSNVDVATSNQAVIDSVDLVCLAVRPQIALDVLRDLRFSAAQTVVSFLPTFTLSDVTTLVTPASNVCRVLPLPSAARGQGPIAIFPAGHEAAKLFASAGALVELDQEEEFKALLASTSLMASFFAANGSVARWLTAKGVGPQRARRYVAQLAAALASGALDESQSFDDLVTDHTTPEGLNAQSLRELNTAGVCKSLNRTLDLIDRRIRGLADYSDTLEKNA